MPEPFLLSRRAHWRGMQGGGTIRRIGQTDAIPQPAVLGASLPWPLIPKHEQRADSTLYTLHEPATPSPRCAARPRPPAFPNGTAAPPRRGSARRTATSAARGAAGGTRGRRRTGAAGAHGLEERRRAGAAPRARSGGGAQRGRRGTGARFLVWGRWRGTRARCCGQWRFGGRGRGSWIVESRAGKLNKLVKSTRRVTVEEYICPTSQEAKNNEL